MTEDQINDQFKKMFSYLEKEFAEVNRKLDLKADKADVDRRFLEMQSRFDRVDERFDRVDERFERVETRLDRIEGRADNMESDLAMIKEAISEQVLPSINDVADTTDDHEHRIARLEEKAA